MQATISIETLLKRITSTGTMHDVVLTMYIPAVLSVSTCVLLSVLKNHFGVCAGTV